MQTWQLNINGIVQGVGFRPTVYRLAQQHQLEGTVSNGGAGVEVRFNADQTQAEEFQQAILAEVPPAAVITHHQLQARSNLDFEGFSIVESREEGGRSVLLTPDQSLCAACRAEMFEVGNRREGYPFITCTQCGPRYSVIQDLPYDRHLTTMAAYTMCGTCAAEYEEVQDRRYFSQTNSCPDCGVQLEMGGRLGEADALLGAIHQAWDRGEIVAIKGIGGYLLTCDALNREAIMTLRERKNRPDKPFALMYPSLEAVQQGYQVGIAELAALTSREAPIVLLRPRTKAKVLAEPGLGVPMLVNPGSADLGLADSGLSTSGSIESLLPDPGLAGLDQVGVMLPYAPVYAWLLRNRKGPIVATSGNFHRSPIVYRDEDRSELNNIADHILSNDRRIVVPQDDSLVRFTDSEQRIILRRSRGMAPTYFPRGLKFPQECILAMGGDLKSAFTLLHQGNPYISQYLGDLAHYDTQQAFSKVRAHLQATLQAQPQVVLHDLHPAYQSRHLGEEWARESGIPAHSFQHHQAHFAAVLAENELLFLEEPVLGVIWDGLGWGTDGQLWGGEYFRWEDQAMTRVAHLEAVPVIGGDRMAKEPRLAALAYSPEHPAIREKFTPQELKLYDQLRKQAPLTTTSMGRLFDAAASALGLIDRQSYEGQAALLLEALARKHYDRHPEYEEELPLQLQTASIPATLASARAQGTPVDRLAHQFFNTLVHLVEKVASQQDIRHLAFSGGVFQNALLVDLLVRHLQPRYQLHFHQQLSPNDENISFGQLILYLLQTQKISPLCA